ncbi:MAG: ShlB/FhaC/HecB family hemolysin secretion/activation protein [Rhodospirillales bacterium]|nr:ShlB/FhaC/HecB family hemolysin secretion/activation protein [Rhodospirillales bacterium]
MKHTFRPFIPAVFGLGLLLMSSSVLAQSLPESALSTAEPGRAFEQFKEESLTRPFSPVIQIEDAMTDAAPANAERVKLKLSSLNLKGVSVYTEADLNHIYDAKLGQTVSLKDVYDIARQLKLKYRNDGYLLAQVVVPPQTIENGLVELQVVEGVIDSVTIQGEESASTDLIRRYANQLTMGQALNARDLERQLLLINDLPGISARSVLSPSPNRTGAADLRIMIERDPFDAQVGVNNYGSRYLGPVQLSAAASVNNRLFDMNERLSAQIVTAPKTANPFDYELGYIGLSYQQPIWNKGTVLEAFYGHTDTEPGFDLKQFDVKGRSNYVSLKLEHPFLRSRAQNLYGRVLFDWRDVTTANNLPEPSRHDHIRALRAGMRYDLLDTLLGVGVNAIDLELAHGLGLFGASDKSDANLSRTFGDPDFFKATIALQRLQRLSRDINLLVSGQGQWAAQSLLASEEFGVGGMMGIGRGFDPSEIVGDDGIAGKIELQWNRPVAWSLVQDYQVFGFFDAGHVWNGDASTSALKEETATSAGLGLRAKVTDKVKADLTLAIPLNRKVDAQRDKDPRLYFSLSREF